MTVGLADLHAPLPEEVQALIVAAADIHRGDQVAFAAPPEEDGEAVAGMVTAVRRDTDRSTVALVVANRVHFVPTDHAVVIVRHRRRMRTGAGGVGRPIT